MDASTSSNVRTGTRALERVIAILIGTVGAALGVGGAYLLTLGGSFYYLPVGLAMVAAAVLIWRGRRSGDLLYAAICVVTLDRDRW